jgi:hypothetical protein
MLPPPPNRLASAVAANKLKLVKAIASSSKNRFMNTSIGWAVQSGAKYNTGNGFSQPWIIHQDS